MKRLGRIAGAAFGFGGYQDQMFGLSVSLKSGSDSWSHFHGFWPKRAGGADIGIVMLLIVEILQAAKVKNVMELLGVPVEIEVDDKFTLVSWRILTEVL